MPGTEKAVQPGPERLLEEEEEEVRCSPLPLPQRLVGLSKVPHAIQFSGLWLFFILVSRSLK